MRGAIAICVLALLGGCSSDSESSGKGGSGNGGAGAGGTSSGGTNTGGTNTGGAGTGGTNTGGTNTGGTNTGGAGTGGGNTGGGGAIWHPAPGTSWQWQLTGTIDTSVDVAMFDIDLENASDSEISDLHGKGRIVICYFSAGSREDWRSDANAFAASDYGKALVGWPGENWLDIRSANVRSIMQKRLDLAVTKKCDGVEPDNVDGYSNDTGFPLTEQDQLDYDGFLAQEAHSRGLSVGLKNSVELVPKLVDGFDWALNEECLSFSECGELAPFIQKGKAVFHVEYVDQPSEGAAKKASVCGDASISGFSTLIKTWDLDAWRLAC